MNSGLIGQPWNQLPEDGDVLEQLTIHTVEDLDGVPADSNPLDGNLAVVEEGQDLDEAAVPNIILQDSELAQLQGRLDNETDNIVEQPPLHRHQPGEAHQLPMSSIRRTPLNEFNQTQPLLSLACPTIFPRGLADFVTPRQRGISYQDYLEHAMKWDDGRFARHHTFRYIALNTLMRQQVFGHSRFYTNKQHRADQR